MMKIRANKSFLGIMCSLILVFIIMGPMAATPALADVGVQPILPGGSNIQPEGQTPIEMASETVEITVRQATQADNDLIQLNPEPYGLQFSNVWFRAVAEVSADFTMRNPTGEGISLTAWFPLASAMESISWEINPDETVPRIESFQVFADGNPIDYIVSELPNPKGSDKPVLPWASFPLAFPAGQDTHIHVSYLVPLVPSIKGSMLALYYVFQTGASWAGSIGQADLIVHLPYPASAETIADIPSSSLDLPYIMAGMSPGLPDGTILEGNQARWEWIDFEPGPQDDFSIWLIDPVDWVELSSVREEVQADPGNGTGWLRLADLYRSLATVGYNSASAFYNTYLPLGMEAYQKAASLLPSHPSPHAGMALLMQSKYMHETNAPPEEMAQILEELATCKDLASKSPYAESGEDYCWFVEDVLSIYSPNATATADVIAQSTVSAQRTLEASIVLVPTDTPAVENTPTLTTEPTGTVLPQPTVTPVPKQAVNSGQGLLILVTAAIVAIIVLGYFISKRIRGGTG